MRKIFIAIAASLLIAVGSSTSLKQVNSKFLQTAMAQQGNMTMQANVTSPNSLPK